MITEVKSINNDKDMRVVVDIQVCAPPTKKVVQLMRNSKS